MISGGDPTAWRGERCLESLIRGDHAHDNPIPAARTECRTHLCTVPPVPRKQHRVPRPPLPPPQGLRPRVPDRVKRRPSRASESSISRHTTDRPGPSDLRLLEPISRRPCLGYEDLLLPMRVHQHPACEIAGCQHLSNIVRDTLGEYVIHDPECMNRLCKLLVLKPDLCIRRQPPG